MDITQVTAPAARSVVAANAIAPAQPVAIEPLLNPGLLSVAPTSVDLSTLGRFLSLASLFQKKTLDLQASVDADTATAAVLADVTTSATALAAVFNELQTNPVSNTGLPSGALGDQSLETQFFQQFGATAEDAQAGLAAIGLNFAPAGTVSIDEDALQDAFARDPATTSAQLDRASDAFFGVVTAQVQAQTANLNFLADDDAAASDPLALPAAIANPNSPFIAGTPQADVVQEAVPQAARQPGPLEQADVQAATDQAQLPQTNAQQVALPQGSEQANVQQANLQRASDAQNLLVQNLVSDTIRNGNELPNDSAQGIPPPVEQAQPPAGNVAQLQQDQLTAAELALRENLDAVARQADAQQQTIAANTAAVAQLRQQQVDTQRGATTALPEERPQDVLTANQANTAARDTDRVVQEARVLAQQVLTERQAARELDEKIAGASEAVRAALAEDLEKRDAARVDNQRLERSQAQARTDQEEQVSDDLEVRAAAARQAADAQRTVRTSAPVAAPETQVDAVPLPAPVPVAPNQAQQAARDPAIAAAIAAYNLNTGPFAAQNVRADVLAPKPRVIPPVASVSKVAAVDAIGTPNAGTQPSR